MPKLTLATAALLLGRPFPPTAGAADAVHPATRGRAATRRLRAYRAHEARPDLGPLGLTRRH